MAYVRGRLGDYSQRHLQLRQLRLYDRYRIAADRVSVCTREFGNVL